MAESTWEGVDRPILEAIRQAEMDQADAMAYVRAVPPGMSDVDLQVHLVALYEGNFFEGRPIESAHVRPVIVSISRLTEKGRRAIGQWPSEDALTTFLQMIDDRIASTADEGSRSRWRQLREAVTAVGTGAGANLLAQFLTAGAHLIH